MIFFNVNHSRGNKGKFLKMAGCLQTHRFLSLFLVFDACLIPPRCAGACNTLKEPAGGLWGILNQTHLKLNHW